MNLKKQTGFKAKLIQATLRLGRKKLLNQKMTFSEKLINFVVDKLVRKKIKKQFGGNLKAFVSGGGALDKERRVFEFCGVAYSSGLWFNRNITSSKLQSNT